MTASTRFAVAIQLLALIAAQKPNAVTSEMLAASVNTNPAAARRILGRLAAAGITEGRLGKGGGAVLARPAKKITLREVFQAVESGEIIARSRKTPRADCPVSECALAAFEETVSKSEAAFLNSLGAVTLKGFMKSIKVKAKKAA